MKIPVPRFRPFNCPLSEVTGSQLSALRDVSEGWFIEYKQELPAASSIAKSIGAFANHYGGWIFYGVAETHDGTNRAGTFEGIPTSEVASGLQRITNAVAQGLSPSPHFDVKLVHGPDPAIGLAPARTLIAIEVPEGGDAPYVHGSGRIYRRVADRSDPREETDRAVLDLLWERSRTRRARLTELLSRKPEFAASEERAPHAQLFFIRDPLRDVQEGGTLTFPAFAKIMRGEESARATRIPFDNCYGSANGYIARQVASNDARTRGFTFEYALGGSSVVTIPLRTVAWENYAHYAHAFELQTLAAKRGWSDALIPMIDVGLFLTLIQAALGQHWDLCTADGVGVRCMAKARLLNVRRHVPFLDSAPYLEFVKQHGLPLILERDVFAPPGTSPESMVAAEPEDSGESPAAPETAEHAGAAPIILLQHILYAFGVPFDVVQQSVLGFFEAAQRSRDAYSGKYK